MLEEHKYDFWPELKEQEATATIAQAREVAAKIAGDMPELSRFLNHMADVQGMLLAFWKWSRMTDKQLFQNEWQNKWESEWKKNRKAWSLSHGKEEHDDRNNSRSNLQHQSRG